MSRATFYINTICLYNAPETSHVRKTEKNEHFQFFQNLSLHSYDAKSAATLKRDFSETARPKISQKAKI